MNIEKELKEISLKVKEVVKGNNIKFKAIDTHINNHKLFKHNGFNILIVNKLEDEELIDYTPIYVLEDNIQLKPTIVMLELENAYVITRIYNINKYGIRVSIRNGLVNDSKTTVKCKLDFQLPSGISINKYMDTDLETDYLFSYSMFKKTYTLNLDTICNVADILVDVVLEICSDEIEAVGRMLINHNKKHTQDDYSRVCDFFEANYGIFSNNDICAIVKNNVISTSFMKGIGSNFISSAYIKGIGIIESYCDDNGCLSNDRSYIYESDRYDFIVSYEEGKTYLSLYGDGLFIVYDESKTLSIYIKEGDKVISYCGSMFLNYNTDVDKAIKDIFNPMIKILNKYTQEEIKNVIGR